MEPNWIWQALMFVWFQILCFLQVEYLVIPSIEKRVRRWEESYGFKPIENRVMGEIIKIKSLMFHCAIRLQKPLSIQEAETNKVGNGGTSFSPLLTFHVHYPFASATTHFLTPCVPSFSRSWKCWDGTWVGFQGRIILWHRLIRLKHQSLSLHSCILANSSSNLCVFKVKFHDTFHQSQCQNPPARKPLKLRESGNGRRKMEDACLYSPLRI